MNIKVKVHQMTFSYPTHQALNNVTFSVQEGEFIGIVGPNGSGKSTLLKNISSYLSPESGTVYLDKCSLDNLSRKDLSKQVGV